MVDGLTVFVRDLMPALAAVAPGAGRDGGGAQTGDDGSDGVGRTRPQGGRLDYIEEISARRVPTGAGTRGAVDNGPEGNAERDRASRRARRTPVTSYDSLNCGVILRAGNT